MRVSASFLAAMAVSLVSVQAAHAQPSDKPQSAATAKAQIAAKSTTAQTRATAPTAQVRSGAEAGKAKIEGVSTMRSTPADGKKDGGCSHSMASDA